MENGETWRHMSTAPKDGARILVTVRSVEQGPADVDVAYWAAADELGAEGWRAGDSEPGRVVGYSEVELKCWMPVATATSGDATTTPAPMPAPWMGSDVRELDGSGI